MNLLQSTSRRAVLSGLAVGAVGVGLTGCNDLAGPLTPAAGELLVWAPATYLEPALTAAFTQVTSLTIVQASSSASADVIVAASGRVDVLSQYNMLTALDPRRLSGIAEIDPTFLRGRFESSPAFALPIGWQITGLGYRRSKVDDIPSSWSDVYASARYPGRTGLSPDPLMLIRAGAKSLGGSFNTISVATADRVASLILNQRRAAATAVNRDAAMLLKHGDLDLVVATSGELAAMQQRDSDLDFVVPREGGLITTEMVAIGRHAKNTSGAYALIDFMLQPIASAAFARLRHMVPTSVAARQQLVRDDPTLAAYSGSSLSAGNEDDVTATVAQLDVLRAAAQRAVA